MMDSYQSCNGVQEFLNLTTRQSHVLIEVETMNPDVACFQVRNMCVLVWNTNMRPTEQILISKVP